MAEPNPPRALDVLVDGAGRLGQLSYLVPDGLDPAVGDAVEIPFGRSQRHGLVIGPSEHPERATREILGVWGPRVRPQDLDVARAVADHYLSDLVSLVARLSPTSGRGSTPLDPGEVVLARSVELPVSDRRRRYLLHGPLDDAPALAAAEATRLAEGTARGQVLVLCPTVATVEATLACFTSGAVRLDGHAPAGSWRGFAEGVARIGVGTRGAALYSAARLEGIVVLDEGHPGHDEARSPYTNARDVAVVRSRIAGCRLTLLGDDPTSSGLGGGVKVVDVESPRWPAMRLFPRGTAGVNVVAPAPLLSLVARARRRGVVPTVVVSSHAPAQRVCAGCGERRPCTVCETSGCRHPAGAPCPACGGHTVRRIGWDEPRLAELLGGPVRVVSIAELERVRDAELVVVFDVDGLLRSPDLVPGSLCASTVVRAARAAAAKGTVCAVTSTPDHPLLRALFDLRSGRALAQHTWSLARQHEAPPFGHTVRLWIGRSARPSTTGWPGRVFGPRRVREEWEVLIHVTPEELTALAPIVTRQRARGKVRVRVD